MIWLRSKVQPVKYFGYKSIVFQGVIHQLHVNSIVVPCWFVCVDCCLPFSPPTLPHFRSHAIMMVVAVSVIHGFIVFVSACYYVLFSIKLLLAKHHFIFLFWEQKGGINTPSMKLWQHYKYVLWSRYSTKPKWLTVQDFRMFTPKCITNNVSMVDNNLSLWFSSIFFSSCVIDVTNLVGDKYGYNIKI